MKKTYLLLMALLFSSLAGFSQLFITELADPSDNASCRYVELYNAGASEVNLNEGWALQRFTNANEDPQTAVNLTGTILPGETYIIAANESSFIDCFGFAPDQSIGSGGPADSNGDDNVQLLNPSGTVVDLFGVPGEDGSGTCHDFEDGRAERIAGVTSGNGGVWDESNWNVWSDGNVEGCTNYTQATQSAAAGDFDPGVWIGGGSVSTDTEVFFTEFTHTISEEGSSIDICVSIVNPDPSVATTVEIDLDGSGTATNGVDYDNGSGVPQAIDFPVTLTFPAGDDSNQCLTIFISEDDSEVEGDETVVLNLQNATGGENASVGAPSQTTLTITDNDFAPTADVTITEIMYNTVSFDDEWVEICTDSPEDQNLSGYTINVNGNVQFTFEPGTVLSGSSCITVSLGSDGDGIYNNNCPFTPDYGIDASTNSTNTLQNSSATISIVADDGISLVDEVSYNNSDGANGNGSSLHLTDFEADNSQTSSNWQEVPDGGSPGIFSINSPCTISETVVSFSTSSEVVSESDGNVEICLSIDNADSENATTVEVALDVVSTATNGTDFDNGSESPVAFPLTVNFPAGDDSEQCISLSVIDDLDLEDNESIILNLENISGGNNAILGANTQFELTVIDNDAEPVDADIVINEIHYNPCGDQGNDDEFEFIELYNNGDSEVNLYGWEVSNAVSLVFEDATIAAGEYIVLAANAASYEGNGYQVFQYSGGATNSGETIELLDAADNLVDQVTYSDSEPWPTSPDGDCPSLELIDPDSDNDDASNWQASFVDNGTPGVENSFEVGGEILGCTYEVADNYNPNATDDDGSCEFSGTGSCPTDLDQNGVTSTSDLLMVLGNFGQTCE